MHTQVGAITETVGIADEDETVPWVLEVHVVQVSKYGQFPSELKNLLSAFDSMVCLLLLLISFLLRSF